ncbi:SRPBCC family protein [Sphingomonas nostoxanthinifaciens]|uniref:hypothetical protein n=1 Tax=Sphingomonas nostoxanthinifaciens TaxID=2872652 RepID=UPI001CC20E3B|nr:hypothetical protein [Sphingomonas nostoxanthinifaciens]UAK25552.1 hypothetical protein K8P63_05165 [Sphingomonas nostoxanthinifaciens]
MRLLGFIAAMALNTATQAADYTVVRATADVNVSAVRAWATIGDYCAGLTKLFDMPCTYATGSGALGTVRSLRDGAVLEPMLAQTAQSYTYGQIAGSNVGLDFHGTLAVQPLAADRSQISYTAVYDQSRLANEARAGRRQAMQTSFEKVVAKAKAIVEAN